MYARTVVLSTIAGSAALVLTLSACSSSKSNGAGSGATSSTTTSAGSSSPVSAGKQLTLANGVLVGPNGHTIYFNTVDTATAIKCSAACAAEWPPLTGSAAAGAGLDQKDFASATRSDGSTQVTFHGHPLYYFAGDSAAGDKKGDALKDGGGEWYATTPAKAIDEKPGVDAGGSGASSSQPASSSSDPGYTY